MKRFRLVEDPQISLGSAPRSGLVLTGLPAVAMIAAQMREPPSAGEKVYTIERVGLQHRVRVWLRNTDGTSSIWFSVGYSIVPLHRWVLIWIRAVFRRRERERDRRDHERNTPDGLPRARSIVRTKIAKLLREE